MPRKKSATAVAEPEATFNPADWDSSYQQRAAEVVASVAEATAMPEPTSSPKSFAEAFAKKPTLPPNPHPIEGIHGEQNSVRLLKEEPNRGRNFPGAWIVRFEKNPNDMLDESGVKYSKERLHPVLAYLKGEGYRWGFGADETGGWGRHWAEGHFTHSEYVDARRVTIHAAAMVGAKLEQAVPI